MLLWMKWVCMSSLRFVICSIYPIVINPEIYLYLMGQEGPIGSLVHLCYSGLNCFVQDLSL